MGPNAWDQGASRKHLLDAIDASLRRLQTDYVDLYQLHSDDADTPLDETLEALDAIVKSGKARYVGVSNFLAYRVAQALGRSESEGLDAHRLAAAALQPAVSRDRTRIAAARARGRAGRDPLQPAGGRPADRQVQGRLGAGRRARASRWARPARRYQERYWNERDFSTVQTSAGASPRGGTCR